MSRCKKIRTENTNFWYFCPKAFSDHRSNSMCYVCCWVFIKFTWYAKLCVCQQGASSPLYANFMSSSNLCLCSKPGRAKLTSIGLGNCFNNCIEMTVNFTGVTFCAPCAPGSYSSMLGMCIVQIFERHSFWKNTPCRGNTLYFMFSRALRKLYRFVFYDESSCCWICIWLGCKKYLYAFKESINKCQSFRFAQALKLY